MTDDAPDIARLKLRAEEIGLTALTDAHLRQLMRATSEAGRRKSQLETELSIFDEPAHVFRADEET